MAGSRNGLKTQILQEEPRALFTHCYGYSLNLAVADAIKSLSFLQSNIDTTFEISKLFQYSPKRLAMFQQLKADLSCATIGFRILCPRQWTVCRETFRGILENYDMLLELWDAVLNDSPDSETRARINGVASQMKTFNFFLGACLLLLVFEHTDNLSKTLQHTKMSAAEGQTVAGMTARTLQVGFGILKYHCLSVVFASYSLSGHKNIGGKKIEKTAIEAGVEEPALPRKRRAPKRYDDNNRSCTLPASPKDYYCAIYFECLDTVTACIKERFEQKSYHIYSNLEQLLLKGDGNENNELFPLYKDDFTRDVLQVQLSTLHANYSIKNETGIHGIIEVIKNMSAAERSLFSEVVKVIRIVLVAPATNSISEQSFSAMRRIKTYLRSKMKQEWLNAVMIILICVELHNNYFFIIIIYIYIHVHRNVYLRKLANYAMVMLVFALPMFFRLLRHCLELFPWRMPGQKCCVCENSRTKDPQVGFHRFPSAAKNPE